MINNWIQTRVDIFTIRSTLDKLKRASKTAEIQKTHIKYKTYPAKVTNKGSNDL